MALAVRRIEATDWPTLRSLRLAALADSPQAFGQRLSEALQQAAEDWQAIARASSAGDRRTWFLAWDEGEPIGMVQARRRPPADCMLFSMWVAPSARRGGTGRALVDEVARWGAAWGASRIVLWVVAGNQPALDFYRRLGFEQLIDGPDVESGADYDALALERADGAGRLNRSADRRLIDRHPRRVEREMQQRRPAGR